ncbi:hypothetical protein CLOM_g21111, partial [Closterium sp. NIES-68]
LKSLASVIKCSPSVGACIGGTELPVIQCGTKCKDAFRISRSSLCCELKNGHAMLSDGTAEELSHGEKIEAKSSDDKNIGIGRRSGRWLVMKLVSAEHMCQPQQLSRYQVFGPEIIRARLA